ncbi:hypothetical protein AGLY_015387 [Aphis glycines]|uniref:Uncharacterized protein n=1 Tax=Aphis glycines TaxID=307491 RepID=A0A6G0T1R7_APHGL|nr:hypothetical protein AGLY_015387 [Aphis glycines]
MSKGSVFITIPGSDLMDFFLLDCLDVPTLTVHVLVGRALLKGDFFIFECDVSGVTDRLVLELVVDGLLFEDSASLSTPGSGSGSLFINIHRSPVWGSCTTEALSVRSLNTDTLLDLVEFLTGSFASIISVSHFTDGLLRDVVLVISSFFLSPFLEISSLFFRSFSSALIVLTVFLVPGESLLFLSFDSFFKDLFLSVKDDVLEYLRTLHFTILDIFLIFASQNAPLYLALTSVPTARKGGNIHFKNKHTTILHTDFHLSRRRLRKTTQNPLIRGKKLHKSAVPFTIDDSKQ